MRSAPTKAEGDSVLRRWAEINLRLQHSYLTIAIDYDGTFAADPEAWTAAIKALTGFGHTVVLITNRVDEYDWAHEVRRAGGEAGIPVLIAGLTSKFEYARTHGYEVDIWIDDNPEWVKGGAWD